MTDADRHIIRTAAVSFTFNGNYGGLDKQEEVSAWCRNELGVAIGSALADFNSTEVVISIDRIRLDIDLGMTSDWQKELGDRIIAGLKQNVGEKVALAGKKEIKPEIKSFEETLAFYLRSGVLPWNAGFKTADEFFRKLNDWLEISSFSELREFFVLIKNPVAFLRFISIPGREIFIHFSIKFTALNKDAVLHFFTETEKIISFLTDDKTLQEFLMKDLKIFFLQRVSEEMQPLELAVTFSAWLQKISEVHPVYPDKIKIADISDTEVRHVTKEWVKKTDFKTKKKTKSSSFKSSKEEPAGMVKEALSKELQDELAEGIFIRNAGVVVIAPFFPVLFSRTGLVKDGIITDVGSALALIGYCVTGKKDVMEFDLLFPKILCGTGPETVFEMPSQIPEKFFEEADEMLASVIEYWSVLKNTSADGLRETFLQRDGKLLFRESEWELYVEQKPFDMLLQHLPWNIQMIRLPWMDHMIKTQWIINL